MVFTEHSNPSERRRYPRTQIRMQLQAIRLDPDGDLLERMELMDISRGGIGALCSRSFYPGQRVLLKLPAPGLSVRNVCGIIRRCQKVQNDYRVGIEFDQPIVSLHGDEISTVMHAAA